MTTRKTKVTTKAKSGKVDTIKKIIKGFVSKVDDHVKDKRSTGKFQYVFNFEVRANTTNGVIYYDVALYDMAAIKGGLGKEVDLATESYVKTCRPIALGMTLKLEGNYSLRPFTYTKGDHKGETVRKPRLTIYNPNDVNELKLADPFLDTDQAPTGPKTPKKRRRTV